MFAAKPVCPSSLRVYRGGDGCQFEFSPVNLGGMIGWPVFMSTDQQIAFWTILVGVVCNSCCSLLGCFLVLRRMSMLGDAISHAVLPGLALAFILSGTLNALPMFTGAALFAMLTAGLSKLLSSHRNTSEESGLGIVFTTLFALGILLIQLFAENVHLDRDAVLEGAIEYVTLETTTLFGLQWPTSLWVTGSVLVGVLIWLVLFWKQIKVASFDPAYASAIGLHGHAMLAVLVIFVALCVVAAFKIVGTVLVVAMLVIPAASAQLVCHRLNRMLFVSVLFSIASTVTGYYAAWYLNSNAAGMMAVMAGVGYVFALLFSPSQGLLFTHYHRRKLKQRIIAEDILGVLFRYEESAETSDETGSSPGMGLSELKRLVGEKYSSQSMKRLIKENLVSSRLDQKYLLTAAGKRLGQRIGRGHRLWESFLDREFALPEDHLHEAAHQMEHYLDQESRSSIEQQLGSPASDPHGKKIPPRPADD